jgi:hypothetical protein
MWNLPHTGENIKGFNYEGLYSMSNGDSKEIFTTYIHTITLDEGNIMMARLIEL